ncbi:hypothetical protein MKO06_12470 [Gramella sp. GC03-9]|uniref:Uncharacterized protein n=1 Tax=Christiangramia oceanisediminis TaxID=2920386 RepID=A0A9X2KYR6_9FLAO|nr:hypothetical protein [Gramella oceanisediminis]MCP9200727.1 hypothetical protein [Gramella oceanisediminis]
MKSEFLDAGVLKAKFKIIKSLPDFARIREKRSSSGLSSVLMFYTRTNDPSGIRVINRPPLLNLSSVEQISGNF